MNEKYLIKYLEEVNANYYLSLIPDYKKYKDHEKIRALMNITTPKNLIDEYYIKQDEYLLSIKDKKIVENIIFKNGISIIHDKILNVKGDLLVSEADNNLLGCYKPLHNCLNNLIISYGGLQIRRDLILQMEKENFYITNTKGKITKGYNLNVDYIFHLTCPVVKSFKPDEEEINNLKLCYDEIFFNFTNLNLNKLIITSLATSNNAFPIYIASKIALIKTKEYLNKNKDKNVIFVLDNEYDYKAYLDNFNLIFLS